MLDSPETSLGAVEACLTDMRNPIETSIATSVLPGCWATCNIMYTCGPQGLFKEWMELHNLSRTLLLALQEEQDAPSCTPLRFALTPSAPSIYIVPSLPPPFHLHALLSYPPPPPPFPSAFPPMW